MSKKYKNMVELMNRFTSAYFEDVDLCFENGECNELSKQISGHLLEVGQLKARIAEFEAERDNNFTAIESLTSTANWQKDIIVKLRAVMREAELEWIPVEVRLPECEKEDGASSRAVACLTNFLEITIGWVDWNSYRQVYTWDWESNGFYGDGIIAWVPIPKRPEVKE